ncbi:MAG TPA: TIGR00730 family Rossman fold protein [Terriglobales bacterium]|nr:TIGR00730 family Rossman fold protein [Terriglobales bacterium]
MNITVFSSSSDAVDPLFFEVARELGRRIGARRDTLIYGGTSIGLMGAVAHAAREAGSPVVGIIPKYIADRRIAFEEADELILTNNLRERKAMMEQRGDAFLVLPGGFGTLEETVEIITLKQLQQHQKPVVILNAHGFYDPLRALFEHFFEQHFAKPASRVLYHFAESAEDAFAYLDSYRPTAVPTKWFEAGK